jgi:hypothetical protein
MNGRQWDSITVGDALGGVAIEILALESRAVRFAKRAQQIQEQVKHIRVAVFGEVLTPVLSCMELTGPPPAFISRRLQGKLLEDACQPATR